MELYFSLFRSIQQTKEDQQKKKLVAPHTRKEGTQKPSQKKKKQKVTSRKVTASTIFFLSFLFFWVFILFLEAVRIDTFILYLMLFGFSL